MKLNYVPEGMTYSPEEIAEGNEYVDAVCHQLEPAARDAFVSALRRQTADETAEALLEEARSAADQILADAEHTPELDEESRKLVAQLAAELRKGTAIPDEKDEQVWIERRSKDLARAVAAFWYDLHDDVRARYEAGGEILDELVSRKLTRNGRDYEMIVSRFSVDASESHALLSNLRAVDYMEHFARLAERQLRIKALEAKLRNIRMIPQRAVEPEPESVPALSFAACAAQIPDYSAAFKPMRDFVIKTGRINDQQLRRIKGSMLLRDVRLHAQQRAIAATCSPLQQAVTILASYKGKVSIQE